MVCGPTAWSPLLLLACQWQHQLPQRQPLPSPPDARRGWSPLQGRQKHDGAQLSASCEWKANNHSGFRWQFNSGSLLLQPHFPNFVKAQCRCFLSTGDSQ
jgi:hypothetical protein